jgi:hypothetical protein
MSEVKSPFLDGEEKINNIGTKEFDTQKEQSQNNTQEHFMNNVERGNKDRQVISANDMRDIPSAETKTEEMGSLEIEEDGKLLRNIIIVMIVLLVLSLAGLIIYNLLNTPEKPANVNDAKIETNVEVNSFDMKSEKFRASSMVIE